MQLKIQRSQRTGGLTGSTVFFALDVRAEYSPEEQHNISRYKLGNQVIYNSRAARKHLDTVQSQMERTKSNKGTDVAAGLARGVFSLAMAKMSLNISIASLGRGHHIECKDLEELLETEDTVRTACKNVTRYLEVAATFDGSEMVIEYDRGEERTHIAQNAPPLIASGAQASEPSPDSPPQPAAQPAPAASAQSFAARGGTGEGVPNAAEALMRQWSGFENRVVAFADERGYTVSLLQVRIGAVATGLLTLYILVQIF